LGAGDAGGTVAAERPRLGGPPASHCISLLPLSVSLSSASHCLSLFCLSLSLSLFCLSLFRWPDGPATHPLRPPVLAFERGAQSGAQSWAPVRGPRRRGRQSQGPPVAAPCDPPVLVASRWPGIEAAAPAGPPALGSGNHGPGKRKWMLIGADEKPKGRYISARQRPRQPRPAPRRRRGRWPAEARGRAVAAREDRREERQKRDT
jgi:hypothetical protein